MERCPRCIAARLQVAGVCGKLGSLAVSRVQPSKACSLCHPTLTLGGAALRRQSPCRRWCAGRSSPPAGAGEDPYDVLDVSPGASRDEVHNLRVLLPDLLVHVHVRHVLNCSLGYLSCLPPQQPVPETAAFFKADGRCHPMQAPSLGYAFFPK